MIRTINTGRDEVVVARMWKAVLSIGLGYLILTSPAFGIRIGPDDRMTYSEFAAANGLKDSEVRELFGASLRVVCPWGTGGVALIGDGRVFLTAAHLLFGVDDAALSPSKCHIESFDGSQSLEIDTKTLIRGKANASASGDGDWVIGKITSVAVGVTPYRLGRSRTPGEQVLAISQGQLNWSGHAYPTPSIGKCRILTVTASSYFTDCDSDKGSSGATLLSPVLSTDEAPELIGIGVWTYYGSAGAYSDKDCDDTSKCATQYVGLRGQLRMAILKLLAK